MVEQRGVPDLTRLTDTSEHYVQQHEQAIRQGDFQKRAMASWGLIAKGEESIPYLLAMMRSTSPESREDAAGALGWLGRTHSGLVERLISALGSETSDQARDSIIAALGELRSKDAIPALAVVIRDEQADGDT